MSVFSCEDCSKSFNGIRPYQDHLTSEKHKQKVNQSIAPTVVDCGNEADPYVICQGSFYRCTLCKLDLSSINQVKLHIAGHLTLKGNNEINSASNVGPLSPSSITNESKFSFHGIEIENVLRDVKIIKSNDPIIF
ncbi:hypothetical protein CEXT_571031 [Caerostris extrusa]|uniref:C2H2-type domain-containing protein n=1 Tax=Caerostris extrusa TaxID=172846 RepID=A0AAV4Y0C1_CAEEX|nr:hypothetical protein CEXT_571031 [Caerostris extrusa]